MKREGLSPSKNTWGRIMNCRDCVCYLDEFCMVEERAFEAIQDGYGTVLDKFKLEYFAKIAEEFEKADEKAGDKFIHPDDNEFYAARCEFGLFRNTIKEKSA